jgi:hypothetical protein
MRGNAQRFDLRICGGIHGGHYNPSGHPAEIIGEFPKIKKAGISRLFL